MHTFTAHTRTHRISPGIKAESTVRVGCLVMAKKAKKQLASDISGILPLYYQVYYLLRKELLGHMHAYGKALPNEVDLSRRFRVARVTIRRALAKLEKEKLITRRRGRHGGTFPVEMTEKPKATASINGLQYQIPQDIEARHDVLSMETVTLPADLAERWGEKPKAKAVRIRRRLVLDDEPIAVVETFAPLKFKPLLKKAKLLRGMILTLLAKAVPSSADQVITVVRGDKDITKLLGVPANSHVVRVTMTVRDAQGEIIETLDGKYRLETFVHQLALFPVSNADTPWQAA